MIIYKYSSQSVSFLIISESIACSLVEIIKFIISNDKGNIIIFVIEIICIIFSVIGTLIYHEIIVIKKCGFNKNVATEIALRAELEGNAIGLLNSDINDDEDEEEEESEGKNNNSSATSIYI